MNDPRTNAAASPDAASLASEVLARTERLASIPAPTGEESVRAAVVRDWWTGDGWTHAHIDGVGNVWAEVSQGEGPALLLGGHLDTVFGREIIHGARRDGERLLGPSVADDSVAVAALSAVGSLLRDAGAGPIWLVATVGEEGLGNLIGIRNALASPPQPIGAFLAVEGNYLGRVSITGVGSIRRRVYVSGPGGHAWEAADAPSAVIATAKIVAALDALGTRGVPGTRISVNVGRMGGGEAVNARAREAWFDLEVRAEGPAALAALERAADQEIARGAEGFRVESDDLGGRPAGGIGEDHPLAGAAAEALAEAGITPSFVPTSTDANAAHQVGIPAVAVGVTTGGGEHTLGEWIDVPPIAAGLEILAATVTRYRAGLR
ncbi:MAG: M20/M25/M40 family metallo-hydrolase [Actinomycetota bacterium]